MTVFHICTSYIIFPILWLSFTMPNFAIIIICSKFYYICCQSWPWPLRASIVQVFLSKSASFFTILLYCFIFFIFLLFGVTSNPDPFFYVWNTSWHYVLQDNTANRTSDCIVVFINFFNSGFVVTVKESWECMLSYLIPKWVTFTLCLFHLTMSHFINKFPWWIIYRFNGPHVAKGLNLIFRYQFMVWPFVLFRTSERLIIFWMV